MIIILKIKLLKLNICCNLPPAFRENSSHYLKKCLFSLSLQDPKHLSLAKSMVMTVNLNKDQAPSEKSKSAAELLTEAFIEALLRHLYRKPSIKDLEQPNFVFFHFFI